MLFSAAPLWSARGRSGAGCASRRRRGDGRRRAGGDFAAVWLSPKSHSRSCCSPAPSLSSERCASLMAADLGVRGDQCTCRWYGLARMTRRRPERRLPFLQRYEEAFRALPGVQCGSHHYGRTRGSAAAEGTLSLSSTDCRCPRTRGYLGSHIMASPEYFSIMGIDFLAGRVFTASDHFFAPKVAVISESFARRYGLRPEETVGRRAVLDHRWVDIVGVVRDVRPGGPAGSLDATALRAVCTEAGRWPAADRREGARRSCLSSLPRFAQAGMRVSIRTCRCTTSARSIRFATHTSAITVS